MHTSIWRHDSLAVGFYWHRLQDHSSKMVTRDVGCKVIGSLSAGCHIICHSNNSPLLTFVTLVFGEEYLPYVTSLIQLFQRSSRAGSERAISNHSSLTNSSPNEIKLRGIRPAVIKYSGQVLKWRISGEWPIVGGQFLASFMLQTNVLMKGWPPRRVAAMDG